MPSPLLSYLCLAASMGLVGIYVGLSKPLVLVFPVILLAWLRYSIGGIAMLGWFKRAPNEAPLSLRHTILLAACSFIGSFLFTLSMLTGVKLTSALSAGIVMACLPAAVALLSRIFLGEHIAHRTLIAIACAVLGIALLAIANLVAQLESGSEINPSNLVASSTGQVLLGHILLLTAVFCEAAYVVIGKQLSSQVSPKRISAFLNLFGWLFSLPLGLYIAMQFNFAAVQWQHWGVLVFYALCASVITVRLWMYGLKTVPASFAGIFTTMLPICATLVGIAMGERFTLMHAMAFVLTLSGIVLVTWPKHSVRKSLPPALPPSSTP